MLPVLWKIFGTIPIYSYGFMVMLGFIVAIWSSLYRAKAFGIHQNRILDLGLVLLFAGLLGARIQFVVEHWSVAPGFGGSDVPFSENIGGALRIWEGGLSFIGGFVLAFVCAILFCLWRKLSVLAILEILAPGVAIGLAFVRVGCFLNGCCYGTFICERAEDAPWYAVVFPENSQPYVGFGSRFVYLFPAQTVSSLFALLLFLALSIYFVKLYARRSRKASGEVFLALIVVYCAFRFFIEYERSGEDPSLGFTSAQKMVLAMFILALPTYAMVVLRRRIKESSGVRT
ncbi:MAG: prolipoprotein diacylglyceryl transferase [Planctomycetes bacterium]|nr:prolipoprotein diacylglyceryl transferase [Planctomycetota bacterium]